MTTPLRDPRRVVTRRPANVGWYALVGAIFVAVPSGIFSYLFSDAPLSPPAELTPKVIGLILFGVGFGSLIGLGLGTCGWIGALIVSFFSNDPRARGGGAAAMIIPSEILTMILIFPEQYGSLNPMIGPIAAVTLPFSIAGSYYFSLLFEERAARRAIALPAASPAPPEEESSAAAAAD